MRLREGYRDECEKSGEKNDGKKNERKEKVGVTMRMWGRARVCVSELTVSYGEWAMRRRRRRT